MGEAKEETESCCLSAEEREALEKVKNEFLTLEGDGLGVSSVERHYPPHSVDGILSRIDQTHYISSRDLKFAFWQIALNDKSKEYTAFTIPGRPFYQFRMMPFGLCNAAQRLLEGGCAHEPRASFGDSEDTIPDIHEVSFTSLPSHSGIVSPLRQELGYTGSTIFRSFEEKQAQAVDHLKLALTSAPVLVHADFKKHFFIQCDATYVGVKAVLFQRSQDDEELPITFFSAKMNKH
ncbi:GD17694 [Drosophila simulans]|uniref:GD17694 n=1 Tax=Drosophila simulans TaxID=7240 RepID=B4NSS1_DROSI|nr:GD17694 [Drosophila simulans]